MATITISRQFGALGGTLGARVAKRLGYKYFNDQLIKDVAKHVGASVKDVTLLEKKKRPSKLMSFLEKVVKVNIIERKRKFKPVDVKEYVEGIKEIVLRYYEQGNCVIIGRGSNYILQDKEDVIHLLLVASKQHRINALVNTFGFTREQAKKAIERADMIRNDFLYYFSQRENHDDPLLYTLCLNMDRLTLDEAEDIVVNLVKQREKRK